VLRKYVRKRISSHSAERNTPDKICSFSFGFQKQGITFDITQSKQQKIKSPIPILTLLILNGQ
jgi:hypothetical protein